jgi:predicted tellurium resistance membrane protein TerC
MKTIVVADALMGLDNVLAVAGAAHGNFVLVSLGLMISIPLVVWGSTLMLKWIDRFPGLIYFGAGVLAWTAAQMMLDEPLLVAYLHGQPIIKVAVYLTIVSGVLFAGLLAARRRAAFR